jgi:mono/diheme cytochrome c family protein
MPAYKDTLSDREIWAVLAYIKSRWPEEIRERQARITQQAEGTVR